MMSLSSSIKRMDTNALVDRWLPPRLQRLRPRLEPRLFEGVHSIDIWLEKSGGWLHSLRAEVAGWIPDATFESWLELATLHKRKLAITLAASSAAFSVGAAVSVGSKGRQVADYSQSIFVRYDSLVGAEQTAQLTVRLNPTRESLSMASFWIDHAYLDRIDITKIEPAPSRVEYDSKRAYFFFSTANGGRRAPIEVRMKTKPEALGMTSGRFGVDELRWVMIDQMVYPTL
jgi:hypothetical protein